jgi:hypothetical protein
MLKSESDYELLSISKDGWMFNYKQTSGRIVKRKFRTNQEYALIFECDKEFDGRELNEMVNILTHDFDWASTIESCHKINYNLDSKTSEVININKPGYKMGIVLFLNRSFSKLLIKKFWLICDIYLCNIISNKSLKNSIEKTSKFKYLYEKNVKGDRKRSNELGSIGEYKKAKLDVTSYGPPDRPTDNSEQIPIVHTTLNPTLTPTLNPTLTHTLTSNLTPYSNIITDDIPTDPRLKNVNSAIFRRPSITPMDLNSSYGSNSSMLSQISMGSSAAMVQYQKEPLEFDRLMEKYNVAKMQRDRYYKDNVNLKKFEKKASYLEGQLQVLTHMVNDLKRENLKLQTALNTAINRNV